MASTHVLDLRGVISPMSLLKCKARLTSMVIDDVLEVFLSDRDVVDDLILIVKKSDDDVLYQRKNSDCICLGIKKGKNSRIDKNLKQQEVL